MKNFRFARFALVAFMALFGSFTAEANGQSLFLYAINEQPAQNGGEMHSINGDWFDIVALASPNGLGSLPDNTPYYQFDSATVTAIHATTDSNGNPISVPVNVPVTVNQISATVQDHTPIPVGNSLVESVTVVTTVNWTVYLYPSTVPVNRGTSTDTWTIRLF